MCDQEISMAYAGDFGGAPKNAPEVAPRAHGYGDAYYAPEARGTRHGGTAPVAPVIVPPPDGMITVDRGDAGDPVSAASSGRLVAATLSPCSQLAGFLSPPCAIAPSLCLANPLVWGMALRGWAAGDRDCHVPRFFFFSLPLVFRAQPAPTCKDPVWAALLAINVVIQAVLAVIYGIPVLNSADSDEVVSSDEGAGKGLSTRTLGIVFVICVALGAVASMLFLVCLIRCAERLVRVTVFASIALNVLLAIVSIFLSPFLALIWIM